MLREVSDLSFGSFSEDEEATAASTNQAFSPPKAYRSSEDGSWTKYTNNLEEREDCSDPDGEDAAQASALSGGKTSGSRAQVRFNTVFEADEQSDEEPQDAVLPTTWSACDTADLGVVAAHLAAAALPPAQQAATNSHVAVSCDPAALLLLQPPIEAEDMLGFGTLDLRSCTLTRHSPAIAPSPQFRLEASFSRAAQVCQGIHSCRQELQHGLYSLLKVCSVESQFAFSRSLEATEWLELPVFSGMAAQLVNSCKHLLCDLASLSLAVCASSQGVWALTSQT